MSYNDLHTPDHKLEIRDGIIFCLDCQTLRKMAEIDEAIAVAEREGVTLPPDMDTFEEKEAWYDKLMAANDTPSDDMPF